VCNLFTKSPKDRWQRERCIRVAQNSGDNLAFVMDNRDIDGKTLIIAWSVIQHLFSKNVYLPRLRIQFCPLALIKSEREKRK